jgi:uncharacterized protein (DUF433 family)
MHWKTFIHTDSQILLGKPVVKGTRLSVEFLLGLFVVGWTEQQILENYPTLNTESLQTVFAFAAECLKEDGYYTSLLSVESTNAVVNFDMFNVQSRHSLT